MNAKPKDPFLRRYSIGDFAKKAGVSTHFLKFYEEKGILHPKVQENGYRHYDIRDASVVLECRRMKNMGLSVKEIEKAINDSTPAETEQLLAQQQNVLEEQLWQQQMHLQGLPSGFASSRSGASAPHRISGFCPTPWTGSFYRRRASTVSCPSGWSGCRWSHQRR